MGLALTPLPRAALAADLAHAAGRAILLYGQLPAAAASSLRGAGASVTRAGSAAEAERLLAASRFDVVAVDARLDGALALARRAADGVTPVFVLPLPDEEEYAILIDPPRRAYLEWTTRVPLAEAMLRLDPLRLGPLRS